MSKEVKQPIQSIPQPPQQDPLAKPMNKLSMKFNMKTMFDQEVGEALTEYINTANQVIATLKTKVTELEEKLPKEEKKVK